MREEPSVQSREVLDISGQEGRGGREAAAARVGNMSTNSTWVWW